MEDFAEEIQRKSRTFHRDGPSMRDAQRWVKELVGLMFPVKINPSIGSEKIGAGLFNLKIKLEALLMPMEKDLSDSPDVIASSFFDQLPSIYRLLLEDAETFSVSDPAAEGIEEVILCYPGFFSLVVYRLAHALYCMKVRFLPRILTEYAHGKTGIDIHPGAVIGRKCFIDHGTGIVIGETTVIGENVKIYQGVTLGALYVNKGLASVKRHPTIEDNVILYAGCAILGGETIIGKNTIVGGNVWLTESVPPDSIVYRKNQVTVRNGRPSEDFIHFVI